MSQRQSHKNSLLKPNDIVNVSATEGNVSDSFIQLGTSMCKGNDQDSVGAGQRTQTYFDSAEPTKGKQADTFGR